MTTGLSEVGLAPWAARVWDCLLGGASHARCDREVAAQIRAVAPWAAQLARRHRMFAWRAIRCCLAAGVRRFIFLGGGVLTAGSLHKIPAAREVIARVVYVDSDPLACCYGQVRLADAAHASMIQADIGDPRAVLWHDQSARLLDRSQPCGLLMVGALFTVTDPGRLAAAWRERLASGSHLVIAHLTLEHVPPPVRPGVSYLCDWRPDEPGEVDGPARILGYGAVVRQP